MNTKKLQLDIDDFNAEYIYTSYDIGGNGHQIVIDSIHKSEFIDEYVRRIREKLSVELQELEDEEDF